LTLVIATTNPGKVREIRLALAGLPIRLFTLSDFPGIAEPEEIGATFGENARDKARYYSAATGHAAAADDSGLAIDALGGRPGVESARYPGATYAEKFANLYRELAPHPRPWTARFVCAVALVSQAPGAMPSPADVLFNGEATVEGEIVPAPRGTNGFGYDPIFFYPPYGRTLGEVGDAEKLAVSHRGKAFAQLRAWLEMTPGVFLRKT